MGGRVVDATEQRLVCKECADVVRVRQWVSDVIGLSARPFWQPTRVFSDPNTTMRDFHSFQLNTDLPWRSEGFNTVVVAGGADGTNATDSSEMLRLPDGRWRAGITLPCQRQSMLTAQVDDHVLLLGGEPIECADTLRWAPSSGSWLALAEDSVSLDVVRGQAVTITSIEGNESRHAVLVLGGTLVGSPTPTNSVDVYSYLNSSLVRDDKLFGLVVVAPLPKPLSEFGAAAASFDDNSSTASIVVAGGVETDGRDPVNTVHVLDVASGVWVTPADSALPVAVRGLTVIRMGDMFYAAGGETADDEVTWAARSIPVDFSAGWTRLANMTSPRAFHAAMVDPTPDGDRMCVAGGLGEEGPIATVECYNVAADRWDAMPAMDVARSHFAAFVLRKA